VTDQPMEEREIPTEAEAELAGTADDTLQPDRAERVRREAAASPELKLRLERQRCAVDALRALDARAPDSLREAIVTAVADAERKAQRRLRWRLPAVRPLTLASGGLAAAAAVTVLAVVLIGGGSEAPTVQQAAPIALRAPTGPPPRTLPGGREIAAEVDGIDFPTWSWLGWEPTGQRTDTIEGHKALTVFYENGAGRQIGYTILDGDALPVSGGKTVTARGERLRLLRLGKAYVVTWRRNGHTCILATRTLNPVRLATLASWET
jgi:hypothetical protein